MIKWIVLTVALFALIVLFLVVRPVLSRLPALNRAARSLLQRQAQAESLRQAATALRERAVELQRQAAATQRQAALLRAGRDA